MARGGDPRGAVIPSSFVDMSGVAAEYESRVRGIAGGELPEAIRLAGRLDPARWELEWHLATWLGEAFGVDRPTCVEITLSNVLGLAYVRLVDDIADGESEAPVSKSDELASALYGAALDVYRKRFAVASPFWSQLELRMREWRAATTSNASQSYLAQRGAPLKISAYALCLLAGRDAAFPALASVLDRALTAMVAYDHYIDWREDIAAARWNAFVERAMLTGARPPRTAPTERDLLVSMLTTDLVEQHFDLIRHELELAANLAAAIGVPGLALHLQKVCDRLDHEGSETAARYAVFAGRGYSLLFHDYPHKAA